MGIFFKLILQIVTAIALIIVGYFIIENSADKLSTREVVMKCKLHEATEKAASLYAKTIDGPRKGDGGQWTNEMPDFRILPIDYIEIRNDWINGRKLFRHVDNQGTEQTGYSTMRRISETTTQYETGFWDYNWSTNITIDRENLLLTERILTPSAFRDEWWSRNCKVIDGGEFDDHHKSIVKRVTSKQKI